MLQKSWYKKDGKRTIYIHIHPTEVVMGDHYGSGQTDNAMAIPIKDFRQGKRHDFILNYFDEKVLAEVLRNL